MNPGKPLMTAKEVVRYLQISDRKFQQMLKSGDAPPHSKIGRMRRWRPEVVEAWSALARAARPLTRFGRWGS